MATEHPPQDTKIVAGPSSWLTAWLELALVGWLEVRTVVERLVGLEIAWWWVPTEVSEAPPWHLTASNPSRWGCKQQPCLCLCWLYSVLRFASALLSPLPTRPIFFLLPLHITSPDARSKEHRREGETQGERERGNNRENKASASRTCAIFSRHRVLNSIMADVSPNVMTCNLVYPFI